MAKFRLLLDTNVYFKDADRAHLPFVALARLCKAEVVQLFVPHVVLREVQSQQSQKAKQLTIALLGSSLGLRSGKGALSEISAELHAIEELVTSKRDAILHAAESAFAGWIDENHVIVVKLDVDQAQAALEAYFTGAPPVKSVKNRADIPDAFIFEAVKSLGGGPIWVVTDDKALREACASLAQVAVFADLETVIKREEIQAELQSLEAATAEAVGAKQSSEQGGEEQQEAAVDLGALAKAFLDYQLSTGELTSTIESDLGEKLMWKKIHSTSIPTTTTKRRSRRTRSRRPSTSSSTGCRILADESSASPSLPT